MQHPPARRISAVRSANDADVTGIGDALIDHGCHTVRDIVLHEATPLSVAGFLERFAIAC
jgi:hypothetical protein